MAGRISAFHLDPKSDQVWKFLTQVGTIGRYSETARAMVMGWVGNAWLYDEHGRADELDTQILLQVDHLRQAADTNNPVVHPFVNCLDALMYGVHLTSNEPGIEVRVTGQNDMTHAFLTVVFARDYDPRRIAAYAKGLGFDLPDLTAANLTSHAVESVSRDANVGKVEINVVVD